MSVQVRMKTTDRSLTSLKNLIDHTVSSIAFKHSKDVTDINIHLASSRKDLLLDVQAIKAWNFPSLHILITSRREFDIGNGIVPLCTRHLCLSSGYIDQDIRRYIQNRLEEDSDLQKFPSNLKLQIESQLMSQSDGM